jgi:magnesium transporter
MQITQIDEHGAQDIPMEDLKRRLTAGTGTLWVDMVGPTPDDVRVMEDVFDFHPLAIEDTHNQRQRPKIEEYADHLASSLTPFPSSRTHRTATPQRRSKRKLNIPPLPVRDRLPGTEYLRGTQLRGQRPPRRRASRRRAPALHRANHRPFPPVSADVMLDVVMDGYFPVLDVLGEEIDELEDDILAAPRQETLNRLFGLKRKLNEVWRVAGQQRDMFNVITRRDLPFLDYESLQYHLRDVYDHLLRITDVSGTYRDLLTGLVDLYVGDLEPPQPGGQPAHRGDRGDRRPGGHHRLLRHELRAHLAALPGDLGRALRHRADGRRRQPHIADLPPSGVVLR